MNLKTNQQRYKATELICDMLGVTEQDVNNYIKTGVIPEAKTEKAKPEKVKPEAKTEKAK